MKPTHDIASSSRTSAPVPAGHHGWGSTLPLTLTVLFAAFALPLYQLFAFTSKHELFSYIVLIPFVSGYWLWLDRSALQPGSASRRRWAPAPFALGLGLIALHWGLKLSGTQLATVDALALTTLAFISALTSVCLYFLPAATLRIIAFPLGFLLFLVPFPGFFHAGVEAALQHASAATSSWIFQLIGTPVFLQGTLMQLPGFSMEVAPECSGIRSSIVLLITSVVAGKLFLRSGWSRILLVALVAPISVIRNAFRITVIGELCVRVGPHMIDSFIHARGGPIFFALSLVPMLAAIYWLARRERKGGKAQNREIGKAENSDLERRVST